MNPNEYHLRKVLKITQCNNFPALTVSLQAVESGLSPLRSALYVVHCALQHLPLYILHAPAFPSRCTLGTLLSISTLRTRRATFYIPFRARRSSSTSHSTLHAPRMTLHTLRSRLQTATLYPPAPHFTRPLNTTISLPPAPHSALYISHPVPAFYTALLALRSAIKRALYNFGTLYMLYTLCNLLHLTSFPICQRKNSDSKLRSYRRWSRLDFTPSCQLHHPVNRSP